ncbi:ejaculatory bulb-specific protein 3-like [Cimex lectularius]|uniref:Chemosensory protein n=1 Tax=Cimex lectularius TaxID=79782 RepID=A0A8I6TJG8_CIMLE|nr:ejaculatory bulb-specific protein 3-like [Cimex lectularius]
MKLLLVFVCLVGLAVSQETYTSQYDNINVDSILANERIVRQYVKCLLDQTRCNNEGKTLKKILPDALRTGCKKCTSTQKVQAEKVLRHLYRQRRNDWNRLKAKYDPSGQYSRFYESML